MEQKKSVMSEVLGWYGAAAIILAFALTSFKVLDPTAPAALILNATGAVGIVVVSASKKNWPPAVLNSVWFVIAVLAMMGVRLGA